MALDYMAIVSTGAYPTPATANRAPLAVSYGLLNFTLPTGSAVVAYLKRTWLLFKKELDNG